MRPSTTLLACLLGVCPLLSAAEQPWQVKSYKGVIPGRTTATELRQTATWGQPLDVVPEPDGSSRLVFRLTPWDQVLAIVKDNVVQFIDLVPQSRHDRLEQIVSSLGLGSLESPAALPAAARRGLPPTSNLTPLVPRGVCAVFWVTERNGERHVAVIRLHSLTDFESWRPLEDASAERPGMSTTAKSASSSHHRQIVQTVLTLIEQRHISGHPVDDEVARRTIDLLLRRLDPWKLYFLQADVDRFQRDARKLSNDLRRGDVQLAQSVQDKFVERVRERVLLAEEILDRNQDFTIDDRIAVTEEVRRYAGNDEEAIEEWRKYVKYQILLQRAAGMDLDQARQTTRHRLHDFVARCEQYDPNDALDQLLDAVLASYDPQSEYYSVRETENQQLMMRRQLVGIGVNLNIKEGYPTIISLMPGGPALRDGRLKEGDRLVAVGQGVDGELENIVGRRLEDVVERIRGSQGTVVRLQVLPADRFETSIYAITRERVEVSGLASALLSGDLLPGNRHAKVGYIRLPAFYEDAKARQAGVKEYRCSSRDLRRALQEFQGAGADVVLLDLRDNGGGSLLEVTETTGVLVGERPVAQIKDRSGAVQITTPPPSPLVWQGPLVVLTNEHSGAGAEILAAAVADHRRGLLVGASRTSGNGTVGDLWDIGGQLFQTTSPPQLGTLRLTTKKCYRSNGQGLQTRGIRPHVVMPPVAADNRGRRPDALEYDEIPAATAAPMEYEVSAALQEELTTLMEKRLARDSFWQRLAVHVEHAAQRQQRTHVSLKEADFLSSVDLPDIESKWPTVPGITDAKLDPYLREVLSIALDYVARVHGRDG